MRAGNPYLALYVTLRYTVRMGEESRTDRTSAHKPASGLTASQVVPDTLDVLAEQ